MKRFILIPALIATLMTAVPNRLEAASDLIYLGSRHSEVPKIQQTLSGKGYFNHEVTGYYGNITKNAVMRFQSDCGISADGIVGPITREKLYSEYNDGDIYWLARIIHAEARGESYEGKVAVANCILNRVKSRDYPNTVYGVIFDTKYGVQYQPTKNGTIYNTPNGDSVEAAKAAVNGYNNIGASMFFYNPKKSTNNWIAKNRTYYATIGNHNFHL